MQQRSLADSGFQPKGDKRTRKQAFLSAMDKSIPWQRIETRMQPFYQKSRQGTGRPPMPLCSMLRIYCMQQWFGLGDRAMAEAWYDVPLLGDFGRLDVFNDPLPDATRILRFRHLLE